MYTHSWVGTMMLVEGLKRAGKNIDTEKLIKALEGVKNFDTGNLCGPISYSPKSHKGGNSWKIYKSDTIKVRYIPQTGWRTVKKI